MPKTSEKRRAYSRAYYHAHKEALRTRKAAWYQDRKARILRQQRDYWQAHKEQISARRRAHYAAHRAQVLAYCRAYYQTHKAQILARREAALARQLPLVPHPHAQEER